MEALRTHSTSLTRDDTFFGNPAKKNFTLISQFLASSSDGKVLTPEDISRFRNERFKDTFARNPEATMESKQLTICAGESTFFAIVFGDESGHARVDWVKDWLENDRLPLQLGWVPNDPPRGLSFAQSFINLHKDLQKKFAQESGLPIDID